MAGGSLKKYPIYGDDAVIGDDAGGVFSRQATKNVNPTGNDLVDGVLSGFAWSGGSITYAFPDSKKDYHYAGEKDNNFGVVSNKIKAAAEFILDTSYGSKANDGFAVEGFTGLHISKGIDSKSTIRYAESSSADPTAYGYYPNSGESGGDIWYGHSFNYDNAISGNYEFATTIHETGHALGLKHGHETGFGFPTLPSKNDSLEYSVMTYNSFVGDNATGYKNEEFGFPQTYMMSDIAALQHMYGANFKVNSDNTTYSWKPNSSNTYVNGKVAIDPGGDNIFATIWDGGGHDKYDLSAYSNNLHLDLRPGSYSVFKGSQLADLDAFSGSPKHIARGNIFNALEYKHDVRSLIEDATGGSGNDVIWGNEVKNRLVGNGGNDSLGGYQGNDVLVGGNGNDTFVFKNGWDRDTIQQLDGNDRIDLRSFNFNSFNQVLAKADNSGQDVILTFGGGDTLTIDHTHKGDLAANDFIL